MHTNKEHTVLFCDLSVAHPPPAPVQLERAVSWACVRRTAMLHGTAGSGTAGSARKMCPVRRPPSQPPRSCPRHPIPDPPRGADARLKPDTPRSPGLSHAAHAHQCMCRAAYWSCLYPRTILVASGEPHRLSLPTALEPPLACTARAGVRPPTLAQSHGNRSPGGRPSEGEDGRQPRRPPLHRLKRLKVGCA